MKISGVKKIKQKIFKNPKGDLFKFVSKKNIFFKTFGEIYFNEINQNQRKGWIKHKKNQCLIICLVGKVKFHLIDKFDKEKEFILKEKSGKILLIPPKVWFSFQSVNKNSLIANLINLPHFDKEVEKSKIIKKYKI